MSFKKRGFIRKSYEINEAELEGHIKASPFYNKYIKLDNRITFLWDKSISGKFEQTTDKGEGHYELLTRIIKTFPKEKRNQLRNILNADDAVIRGYYFPDEDELFFYQWNRGDKKRQLVDPTDKEINEVRKKLNVKDSDPELAHAMLIEETAPAEEEMKNFFEERTNKHIGLVKKYLKEACEHYPDLADILQKRGEEHDSSKFKPPEYEPYVHITWQYKVEGEGGEYELGDDMAQRCHNTSFDHCKGNRHHPEYHDNHLNENPISFEHRDQPSGIIVDATRMDRPSIIEMCCDWMAVSAERNPANGRGPKEWADDNIGRRWKFTQRQEELIYEVIESIWNQ